VGPRAGLEAAAKTEYPIIVPDENWTPIFQPLT